MKVKFIPEICTGGEYTGHVILKMPTYAERLGMYTDDMMDETEGEPGKEAETPAEKRKAARRATARGKALMESVGRQLGTYLIEVHITRKKDNYLFNTFEQLNYDSDMVAVLTECAQRVIGKYEVGTAPLVPHSGVQSEQLITA